MIVPLVDRGNGLWGSSSPAWDHLIERESSGRPTVIQSPNVVDINTGGNEAEGLFQITPKTWDRHGGRDFAPSARHATPHQQAIVAARIFTRNPTGSDWGAGRPGRENPRDLAAGLVPLDAPAPAWRPEPYGLPPGTNSGGYGNGGKEFPAWVHQLGAAFNVRPSTYPGHQESDRNEAGYAPNPQRLNRGIDWSGSVADMQRFADYCFSIRGELEQVIWENPQTGRRIGVAGGKDVTATPYYDYNGGYNDHRDHVHTRQSHSLPLPGGARPAPVPPPRPAFTEIEMFNGRNNSSVRSRKPINFFIHTQEGPPGHEISDATAEDLARYCQGQNNVSYHYTIRDRKVYDVVDTDYYSWSVLSANVFSINLCFAGSSVLLTRQQWLEKYGADIDIAAYLAVQDCQKYGMSTEVLVPPYNGAARSGISDHKYVTEKLGIGTHHDVGPNFPWDVFVAAVNKYARGEGEEDDMFTDEDRRKLNEMFDEYSAKRRAPSRSFFAKDQLWGETPLGFEWNIDGNVNELYMTWGYLLGVKSIEADVEFIAANGVATASWAGSIKDEAGKRWLAEVGQQWCQGLVGFRKRLYARLTEPEAVSAQGVQAFDYEAVAEAVARRNPAPTNPVSSDAGEVARLRDDLERAQRENARLLAEKFGAPSTAVATIEDMPNKVDIGAIIGQLANSMEDWTEFALSMDAKQRAALTSTLEALKLPKGSDK